MGMKKEGPAVGGGAFGWDGDYLPSEVIFLI